MLVLGLIVIILLVVYGVILFTQQNELTAQARRLEDLEMARPVKIEDGPARMARLRQDR